MGVKGLWRLVASAGKPVSLESLNGKILAVDVSIWLNKAAKGMRDKRGNAIYNAHLVLMFHRICKLLFYGIKPVFVFDGGVPELKKKTLRLRRERRSQADSNRKRTKDQILKNYLQTKALEAVTGVKSTTKLQLRDKKEKEDIFKLPERPVQNDSSDSSSDDDVLNEDEWLRTLNESRVQLMFDKAEKLDTSSAEFNALPAEVKHELLTEIKDYQRRRYRRKNEAEVKLPQEAGTFSDFQLGNLMKRGQITHQIDELRKEMNSSMAAQFIELYHDVDQTKYKDKHIEGKRYVSNEKQGYVLIKKNVKDKSQNVLFHSSLDDDYARFKKREDDAAENPGDVFRKLEREPARFQTIVEKNASRKRLKSDSSDEGSVVEVKIKVPRLTGPEAVTLSKDVTQDTAKDEVELMSASSSEESETDDTVNVTERKMEGICTTEKVPSESALSKEVVEQTPNNQKEIVLLSNNDSSRESKTEASETFVGGKIDVSVATKQEVKELTEISNDPVVTEPSSIMSAPSKMNSTVSRPPPNSIKIKSTSNTVDDSSAKISSANDGKIENVRNDKNIAVVTETNDFTKMSSSVTDNDNPCDVTPMIKPTDLITDKDTSTSLISPAISSSRTPSSNLSNPPETPMESNEIDFPGEENIKQAEQQPGPSQTAPSQPAPSQPAPSQTAPSQPAPSQPAPSQPGPSQPAPQIPMEDLIGLQKDLEKEHDRLEDTTKKLKRQAATLSDETYQDVQELLRLFGIPYLVSPAEAEAQCAQLDFSKLTDGSITDDSDIFLFGGHRVYKNIFDQKKYAEVYLLDDLIKKLYLTREKLIALAFMTGSDYTEGIRGIGAVTGMEVLHEFNKNKPKETLKFFRDWLRGKIKDFNPGSNLKNKLRDVDMSQTFNSSLVWDAYLSPTVDTSEEQFEWSNPDIDALKEYANEKLGWLYNKTDELLMPVLESMKKRKERQKTLMAYFQPKVEDDIETNIKSNRLKKVLSKMSSKDYTENEAGPSGLSSKKSEKPEIFFEMDDNDVDSDILKVSLNDIKPSGTRSTASASRPYYSKTLISTSQSNVDQSLPYIDDSDVVSKRPRRSVKSSEPSTSSTISSNEHVQAMKVANLVKAAEESLKPTTPYIAIQNVNNMVWNRMRGKNKQMKRGQRGGKSRRSKTTADLLEQVNTAKSSVQSSDSESDH